MYRTESSENEIVKIDCADEYSGALTKSGFLFVWGKNNSGQLGIGSGIGIDYTESEKFPTLVEKVEQEIKYVDFNCGENVMMIKDETGLLYKTGWKVDYLPKVMETSKIINPKIYFCGNKYFCMIDGKD